MGWEFPPCSAWRVPADGHVTPAEVTEGHPRPHPGKGVPALPTPSRSCLQMVLQPIFWDLKGFHCHGRLFWAGLCSVLRKEGGPCSALAGSLQLPLPSSSSLRTAPHSQLRHWQPPRLAGNESQSPRRKGELWIRNLDHSG